MLWDICEFRTSFHQFLSRITTWPRVVALCEANRNGALAPKGPPLSNRTIFRIIVAPNFSVTEVELRSSDHHCFQIRLLRSGTMSLHCSCDDWVVGGPAWLILIVPIPFSLCLAPHFNLQPLARLFQKKKKKEPLAQIAPLPTRPMKSIIRLRLRSPGSCSAWREKSKWACKIYQAVGLQLRLSDDFLSGLLAQIHTTRPDPRGRESYSIWLRVFSSYHSHPLR